MSDRDLLEAAARAVGLRLEWDGHPDNWAPMYYEGKTYHSWEPLEDDGDALRLAVKLGIDVQFAAGATWVKLREGDRALELHHEPHASDPCASTRRAIVRAAAAMAPAP